MQNDMRDRIVELLKKADKNTSAKFITDYEDAILDNADYLIANGVIVPPCKVGDTIYQTDGVRIYKSRVKQIIYDTDNIAFDERAIGKTVFLTREEAEQALKEREINA